MSCFRLGRCGDYGWFMVDLVGHSGVFHLVSHLLQSLDASRKPERGSTRQGTRSEVKEKKADDQCHPEIR
jgi:hypothetical protein